MMSLVWTSAEARRLAVRVAVFVWPPVNTSTDHEPSVGGTRSLSMITADAGRGASAKPTRRAKTDGTRTRRLERMDPPLLPTAERARGAIVIDPLARGGIAPPRRRVVVTTCARANTQENSCAVVRRRLHERIEAAYLVAMARTARAPRPCVY